MSCRLFILLLLCNWQLVAKTYYVSEDGLLINKGTEESPLPFDYFERSRNHAGDIFIVMDGVYPNHWITRIYGEKNRPVIIKSENWLGADLVGIKEKRDNTRKILQIKGDYSWFVDFEIYEKEASNRIRNNGEEFYFSDGVHLYGKGGKVINCVAHDVLIGFSTWSAALEGEIYGCLAYNIGWNDLESSRKNKGHGHGYYVQNKAGQSTYKKLALNIVWGTGSEGFHSYTQKGNIEYFHFENNLAYNLIGFNQSRSIGRGFILGGYQPVTGLKLINNHLYKVSLQVGYGANYPIISKNVSITQNYLIESKINLYYLEDMKYFADNFIVSSDLLLTAIQDREKSDNTWDWPFKDNKIHLVDRSGSLRIGIQELTVKGTRYVPLDESKWKNNFNEVTTKVPASKAFLYQNKYNPDRALVYVYNFKSLDNFPVEMGKFLEKGEKFEVRDIENIHKIIYQGVYEGQPVHLPMNLTELAELSGNLPKEHAKHSDKRFNAFLIKKVN
ncbi:hypothetical protein QQ020_35325 [Fulvivirgaceae bacterium BMA12]|uniref:Uncharacterized protein n=1 Tax=Agaribacillus aureus TaxID=3051825 RepID=A0ABT8LL05_9BACT|nr:hypothetical protein [Fulvivirgaceae bacterium BMA12]